MSASGPRRAQIDRKSIATGPPGAHECGNSKDLPKEISDRKVIDMLFDKVFADPELAPFFDGIDDERIREKQELLMEICFEGLQVLETVYLREAHMHMIQNKGLTEHHWEKFVKHFEDVMKELGTLIPCEKRTSAMQNIRATRMYFRKP